MKRISSGVAALALSVALVPAAHALSTQSASGSSGGLQWTAQSMLTGAGIGGTGSASQSGNSTYFPTFPDYGGVVGLLMSTSGGNFICSGTLLSDRQSILTAGHCVSNGFGTADPISTTAFFQPPSGLGTNASIYGSASATQIAVSGYKVNSQYTGEVVDQNDIAVLRLATQAPTWATSYGLYTGNLTGQSFNVAGYGLRGTGTGTAASGGSEGRLRQGDNRYEYALGDATFGGFFTDRDATTGENFFGTAEIEHSFLSDFDSGLAVNDAGSRLAGAFGAAPAFANLGLGAREVGVAPGDSGGPSFVNGLVAGVSSYILSFGTGFGDVDGGGANSSFGEFSGFVPTSIHADFINAAMVPEPGTYALMGLGLLGIGWVLRRRQTS